MTIGLMSDFTQLIIAGLAALAGGASLVVNGNLVIQFRRRPAPKSPAKDAGQPAAPTVDD